MEIHSFGSALWVDHDDIMLNEFDFTSQRSLTFKTTPGFIESATSPDWAGWFGVRARACPCPASGGRSAELCRPPNDIYML